MPSKAEWERRIEANPRPVESAPSSSHCSTALDRASNLGQVYGGAAAIRDIAESSSNIAGLCMEQRHVDDLQALAGMADLLCREVMREWDVLAGKSGR